MKIVALDGGVLNPGDISWQPVADLGELIVYDFTGPDKLEERSRGAEILLVNKTQISATDARFLTSCKMISLLATGANTVDLQALARAGIMVCNAPAYGVNDVAQHAMALLLELCRNTSMHTQSVIKGDWQICDQWCYWIKPPLSLAGLTMGIIGFGAIGQAVGKMAHALGMEILANAPTHKASTGYPFRYVSLDEIWEKSDVISLNCPLNKDTAHIINSGSIAAMRKGVILINTARGGLVDEDAAARGLHEGKIAAMGTDVLSVEPPTADNPLLKAPNILITPHIAWATTRARQNIIDITARNIQAFLAGTPQNVINLTAKLPIHG